MNKTNRTGVRVVRQFPSEEESAPVPKTIRLPPDVWRRLEAIAKAEKKSRNFVVYWFLRWSVEDYETEKKNGRR